MNVDLKLIGVIVLFLVILGCIPQLLLAGIYIGVCRIWQSVCYIAILLLRICYFVFSHDILQQIYNVSLQAMITAWYYLMLLPAHIRLFIRPRTRHILRAAEAPMANQPPYPGFNTPPNELNAIPRLAGANQGRVRKLQCPAVLESGRQCRMTRNEVPGDDSMWFCRDAHRQRWNEGHRAAE